jgi:DNA-binding CsgD family transcriptional regulator
MTSLPHPGDAFAAIGRRLFETSERPVLTLTADGRVLDVNAAAERLFQAPARLMRDPMGRLLCRRAGRWCTVSEPLQRALAGGTAQCAVDAAPPLWSVLSFDRLPWAHDTTPAAGLAAVLATLRAPSGNDAQLLGERDQLTPAEMRVATLLTSGTAPARIAALLHIELCTVRTHIRHLCDKTGTRRQLELVARLLGQAPREAALELA